MLVFSPGPGTPQDYPESLAILENVKGKIPILGVCLGFQMILQQEGAAIIRQNQVLHGVETEILADPSSVTYRKITGPIHVGRYHSLQVDPDSLRKLPLSIKITRSTAELLPCQNGHLGPLEICVGLSSCFKATSATGCLRREDI